MNDNLLKSLFYFVVFVLIQVLVLNNIHLLRVATPFLYLYFLIKLPLGLSKSPMLLLSFFTGLVIDIFSNTPGMHAAACTLAGFCRGSLVRFFISKELYAGAYPSVVLFGFGGFLRFVVSFVTLHHAMLFLVDSFTLFDPLFLFARIFSSILVTVLLIFIVEAFNTEAIKHEE